MAAGQRGNAILISAILVFALTMTALGVSRMLVAWTRQNTGKKLLLGTQAFAMAQAALEDDVASLPDTPSPAKPAGNSNYNFAPGLPAITGWTVSTATASTTWTGANGGPFVGTANVTYSGTVGGSPWTITRQLIVQVASSNAAANAWEVNIQGPSGVGP